MLHHGPVRVPSDAQPGKAVIRVELPPGSKFTSVLTDIPVELVKEKPKG
jgi:hypothetical protein